MRKTYLVARREFLENVRTKTFWIGILIFPVILLLSFVVPHWLMKKKEVRRYAVVDRSGWLLERIVERATLPDLTRVFSELAARQREGASLRRFPDFLRQAAPFLERLDQDQLRGVAEGFARLSGPEGAWLLEREELRRVFPESQLAEVKRLIDEHLDALRQWWRDLPPGEAKKVAPDLARSRYHRIEIEAPPGRDIIEVLNEQIARGDLFAYFVIGEDPVQGNEGCKYVSNNLTDDDLRRWFERLATAEVRSRRLAEKNIDPEVARWIQSTLGFESRKVTEAGEEAEIASEDTALQWAPIAFVYLLWIAVFTISQMLLTNTIEEKSNRIIEVLLSSISPLELMIGKILGIAVTGLAVLGSWVTCLLAGIKLAPYFVEDLGQVDLTVIVRDPVYLVSFLVYFVLGYLLFASLLVGIGSVCNSLKEAQNLMMPVTIMLVLPLLAMIPIAQDPNGTLARVLSFIPPFTPFVMMNRAAGPPTTLEYVLTTILLMVSIALSMWGAAKVFRIGILLTGKPPALRDLLRWVGAPVGSGAAMWARWIGRSRP